MNLQGTHYRIKTKNGEIEVNNTIEARMQRYKKSLRSEVARILFK